MIKAIWKGNTPYSKFLITVGITLLSAVAFTLLSTGLATSIFNVSMLQLQAMMQTMTEPVAISIMKLVQVISAIGTFIIPPFIIAYLFSNRPRHYLSLDTQPHKSLYIVVVILMIVSTPVINYLGEINSHLHLPGYLKSVEDWMRESEDQAAKLTKAFLNMNGRRDLLLNLFMIGLLPALGEELLFRGIIQKLFTQWSKNIHVGIWSSAFFFSAMHMQFYGFLPRMVLGAMLGYMLAWSGSLWLPVLGHFVNNAGAVIFTYLFQKGIIQTDPDAIGTESDFIPVLISLALSVGLFYLIYRKSANNIYYKEEMITE